MANTRKYASMASYVPKQGKNAGTVVDVMQLKLPGTGWRGWSCTAESVPEVLSCIEEAIIEMQECWTEFNETANLRAEVASLHRKIEADTVLLTRFQGSGSGMKAAYAAVNAEIKQSRDRIAVLNGTAPAPVKPKREARTVTQEMHPNDITLPNEEQG